MSAETIIQHQLIRYEDLRLFPYLDCCGKPWRECLCIVKGKLTIGVGRNLDEVGITKNEALYLLDNDLGRVRAELDQALPWWRELDEIRQRVMLDMGFNLGVLTPPATAKLLTFGHTLDLLKHGHYAEAADNLTKTKWHTDVGIRALELEAMLRQPVEV